jgi:hypothetical protein
MGRIKDKRCWKRDWGSLQGIWSGMLNERSRRIRHHHELRTDRNRQQISSSR